MSTITGLAMVRIFRPFRSFGVLICLRRGVEAARALFHPEQDLDVARFELGGEVLSDLALDRRHHVVEIAKHVGQVEHAELGNDGGDDAGRRLADVEIAEDDGVEHLALVAGLLGRKRLDLQVLAGALGHAIDEPLDRTPVRDTA